MASNMLEGHRIAGILNGELRFNNEGHAISFANHVTSMLSDRFGLLFIVTFRRYFELALWLTCGNAAHVLLTENLPHLAHLSPGSTGHRLNQWHSLQLALNRFDFGDADAIVRLRTDVTPLPALPFPPAAGTIYAFSDRVFYGARATFVHAYGRMYDSASSVYVADASLEDAASHALVIATRMNTGSGHETGGCVTPCTYIRLRVPSGWDERKCLNQLLTPSRLSHGLPYRHAAPWRYAARRSEACLARGTPNTSTHPDIGFCSEVAMTYHLAANNVTCMPFPGAVEMETYANRIDFNWGTRSNSSSHANSSDMQVSPPSCEPTPFRDLLSAHNAHLKSGGQHG